MNLIKCVGVNILNDHVNDNQTFEYNLTTNVFCKKTFLSCNHYFLFSVLKCCSYFFQNIHKLK